MKTARPWTTRRWSWVKKYRASVKAEWFTPLTQSRGDNPKSLVLRTSAAVGLIGSYNRVTGLSPFERFYLGGVFLSGFVLDGREILNLRGYDDLSLTAPDRNTGAPVVAKYSAELRYPLEHQPQCDHLHAGIFGGWKYLGRPSCVQSIPSLPVWRRGIADFLAHVWLAGLGLRMEVG